GAVHEAHDQLQLVHALEVGDLRLVSGLAERLEPALDEGRNAAAQHRLLSKEVGFRLLGEGRLDDAGARTADALGVGERGLLRLAARVLMDGEKPRSALALDEDLAYAMTGNLGRDQREVDVLGGVDGAEADVEAVREHQGLPRTERRLHRLAVELRLAGVGGQDHDDVGFRRRAGRGKDTESLGLRPCARAASVGQAYHHLLAAVAEVQGVGVPLAAVAEDGNPQPAAVLEVRILVVIDLGHGSIPRYALCACSAPSADPPLTIAILPVLTISTIPRGRNRSTRPSTFSLSPVISTITESVPTSTIRARKIDTSPDSSARVAGSHRTRIRARSRSTVGRWVTSRTSVTGTSFRRLAATRCAGTRAVSTTIVMRE